MPYLVRSFTSIPWIEVTLCVCAIDLQRSVSVSDLGAGQGDAPENIESEANAEVARQKLKEQQKVFDQLLPSICTPVFSQSGILQQRDV